MKWEDVKVGARVRHNPKKDYGQYHRKGQVGTIKSINNRIFEVYLDDGSPLGDFGPSWADPSIFDLVTTNSKSECPCGIYRGDCDYHRD